MPVISIKKRKPTNQLGSLLNSLYENVLLLCENDEIKLKNDTKNKKWRQFVKSGQLQIINSSEEEKGKFKFSKINGKDILVIDPIYSNEDISNTIIFTNVKYRVFSDLLHRVRNAFAHNQIFVEDDYVTLYDRLTPKSKCLTMIAHVKIEVLEKLIETIKSMN